MLLLKLYKSAFNDYLYEDCKFLLFKRTILDKVEEMYYLKDEYAKSTVTWLQPNIQKKISMK